MFALTTPESIAAIFGGGILLMQTWFLLDGKRTEAKRLAAEEDRKREAEERREADRMTHEKLISVERGQNEIKGYVNGPLSFALKELARVLVDNAKRTGSDTDILLADEAVKRSDQHEADKASVEAGKLVTEAVNQKIIANFKANTPPSASKL